MYVLACIPIYSDRRRDLCCDPAGSQESAPELGVGYELAIKNAPLTGSLSNGRHRGTNPATCAGARHKWRPDEEITFRRMNTPAGLETSDRVRNFGP
jgi:hypothetical protein